MGWICLVESKHHSWKGRQIVSFWIIFPTEGEACLFVIDHDFHLISEVNISRFYFVTYLPQSSVGVGRWGDRLRQHQGRAEIFCGLVNNCSCFHLQLKPYLYHKNNHRKQHLSKKLLNPNRSRLEASPEEKGFWYFMFSYILQDWKRCCPRTIVELFVNVTTCSKKCSPVDANLLEEIHEAKHLRLWTIFNHLLANKH